MEVECPQKWEEVEQELSRVKSHAVGIGQQGLTQLDVRIPQRPFAAGAGFCHQLLQGEVKIRNIPQKIGFLEE